MQCNILLLLLLLQIFKVIVIVTVLYHTDLGGISINNSNVQMFTVIVIYYIALLLTHV